jgi:hypothetical protein
LSLGKGHATTRFRQSNHWISDCVAARRALISAHDETTFGVNEVQVATISWSAGMVDAIDHRHVGHPHGSMSRA